MSDWISVKDRLPEDGQFVDIFTMSCGRWVDVEFYNEEYEWIKIINGFSYHLKSAKQKGKVHVAVQELKDKVKSFSLLR